MPHDCIYHQLMIVQPWAYDCIYHRVVLVYISTRCLGKQVPILPIAPYATPASYLTSLRVLLYQREKYPTLKGATGRSSVFFSKYHVHQLRYVGNGDSAVFVHIILRRQFLDFLEIRSPTCISLRLAIRNPKHTS